MEGSETKRQITALPRIFQPGSHRGISQRSQLWSELLLSGVLRWQRRCHGAGARGAWATSGTVTRDHQWCQPKRQRGLAWTQRAPLEPARRCLLVLKTLRAPGFGLALDREWSGSVHEGAVTPGTSPVQDHRGLSQLRMAREGQEEQQCDTAPMETGAEPPEPHPATHLQLPQLWEIRNPCLKTSHPLLT